MAHAVEVRSLDKKSGRHVVCTAEGELIKLKPQNLLAFADAGASDMRRAWKCRVCLQTVPRSESRVRIHVKRSSGTRLLRKLSHVTHAL